MSENTSENTLSLRSTLQDLLVKGKSQTINVDILRNIINSIEQKIDTDISVDNLKQIIDKITNQVDLVNDGTIDVPKVTIINNELDIINRIINSDFSNELLATLNVNVNISDIENQLTKLDDFRKTIEEKINTIKRDPIGFCDDCCDC